MEQKKVVELIRSLTSSEIKKFIAYASSDYAKQSTPVIAFAKWLGERHPLLHNLDAKEACAAAYGSEQAFDQKQFNYLSSSLLHCALQFLAIESCTQDAHTHAYYTLKALSEHGLDKHYRFAFEKDKAMLEANPLKDSYHFYQLYRLEDLDRKHFDKQGIRRLHESAQRAVDHLDLFYLTEKLKYTCAMLNSQEWVAAPFAFRYLDELRTFFAQNPMPPNAPGVEIYFRIFRLLTIPHAHDDFEKLKTLIKTQSNSFQAEEMSQIYQYGLNYCISQMRFESERFTLEAFELYKEGIESGILITDGKLSPWHFKNVIKLALKLRQYTWTEHFILEKNMLLEQHFKQDAMHYNLAELHFHTGNMNKALTHLNKVEFTDIHYNLGAKVMLVKIYFQQNAFEALLSLLHSFRVFLKRNKVITDSVRKAYLNFIQMVGKLEKANKRERQGLMHKIESSELMVEKQWLLDQIK